jgi:DNA-binding CsgD family transcriptional regulator
MREHCECENGGPVLMVEHLSPREMEVLQLLAEGMTSPQIAAILVTQRETIDTHAHNLIDKLGVHNRIQAINRAQAVALAAAPGTLSPIAQTVAALLAQHPEVMAELVEAGVIR